MLVVQAAAVRAEIEKTSSQPVWALQSSTVFMPRLIENHQIYMGTPRVQRPCSVLSRLSAGAASYDP
jgi:hypothetical protein